jgi:hypothetical protein
MKGKHYSLGKLGAGITVILLLTMATTNLAQAQRQLRRANRLVEADDSQLQWLSYDPFARSGRGRSTNKTAGNTTEPETATAEPTRSSLITDDTDATTQQSTSMIGVRPPIRIPYRPPLRSPYRPPWP